jgi:diguanylate cyclase (GGDEF)-like protein
VDYREVQLELLDYLSRDQMTPIEVVGEILQRRNADPEIYSKLIASFINVTLPEENAQLVFHRLLKHHQKMSKELGRRLDIRVTAMDFAIQHPELVKNPVVVDQGTLELSQRLAAVDDLTGLFNRRFLEIALTKEIHRARRHGHMFSILFIDLDDFKRINDVNGHEVGDRVLKTVGDSISKLLRNEDVGARYGGEEFVIILPQTDGAGALAFGRRLQEVLLATDTGSGTPVTFSGGVASYPESAGTATQLLKNADTALYQSKLNGKNQIRIHGQEKRSATRYAASFSGQVVTNNGSASLRLSNLSAKGFSGASDRFLHPGKELSIKLYPGNGKSSSDPAPTEQDEPSTVTVRIVWSKKVTGSKYHVGGTWASADQSLLESLLPEDAL